MRLSNSFIQGTRLDHNHLLSPMREDANLKINVRTLTASYHKFCYERQTIIDLENGSVLGEILRKGWSYCNLEARWPRIMSPSQICCLDLIFEVTNWNDGDNLKRQSARLPV
jgi:hypothetical protein